MFLITGLLGMMALGSLAFLAFNDESDDESELDAEETEAPAEASDRTFDFDPDPENATPGDPVPGPAGDEADLAEAQPAGVAPISDDLLTAESPALPDPAGQDLTGSDGGETIQGSDASEVIRSSGAGDTLLGAAGDDTLMGDAGDDDLYGDEGDDDLYGGTGDDTMMGGLGADFLHGNAGHDALHGREGEDTLIGGRGHDTLLGGEGDDLLSGLDRGADGSDLDGRDYLNGGSGDDTMFAGEDDVVSLGTGADVLVLGDWMTSQGAQLLDFDEDEDQLMVVYNDTAHGVEPDVSLRLNAGDPALTEIVLGDQVLATLPTEDAPDLSSIVLIGESTLADLGLEMPGARQAG